MSATATATATRRSTGRRWAPWLAMAVVLVGALVIGSWPHGSSTLDSRARAIDAKLRCPSCESQSVGSSDSPAANAIRIEVRRRLAKNQSEDQITDYLVGKYGEDILLEPARSGISALVWAIPVVAVIVAFVAIGFRFRGWRTRPGGAAVSADDRAMVDAARLQAERR